MKNKSFYKRNVETLKILILKYKTVVTKTEYI